MSDLEKKTVQVKINDILALVHCAEDYGYTTLYADFAAMTGYVSQDQISSYINQHVKHSDGYTEEDQEQADDVLGKWRDDYCVKEQK